MTSLRDRTLRIQKLWINLNDFPPVDWRKWKIPWGGSTL